MAPPDQRPGLSSAEARERQARFGPNDIEDRERHGLFHTLGQIASEPMFLLLLVAAGIYLAVGDLGEGLLLAAFALLSVGLVVVQERRSERALDALRSLAAPQARVWRDGELTRIAARDLVPGDLMLVGEGERVAADAVLREAVGVAVDESLLTGESVPVSKIASIEAGVEAVGEPGGDGSPWLNAGTLVVSGHGLAEVLAIGRSTAMGRIGASLAAIEPPAAPLEVQLRRLVRVFGLLAFALSALLATWVGTARGDWLQGLLAGIALGMAMLPEEFPMALAVFLALGAWRLTRVQVLARRPAVIEALGSASFLCVDKTGTLTENRMRLRLLVPWRGESLDLSSRPAGQPLPAASHPLLEYAALASRRGSADPMDRAVIARADEALAGTPRLHHDWQVSREYPLTTELAAMTQAWSDGNGAGATVAAKGSPEAVADLCHLAAGPHAALMEQVHELAEQGWRVLAVAQAAAPDGGPAELQHDHDFVLLGLLAFEDPLRAGVREAVEQAREAGIAVAMITGDHVATALAIAREAGLDTAAGALTGAELARLDEGGLLDAVRRVRVFARVTPEQKLRIVEALRANGEVVAMTGDGVNDAPALKAAHVGIAMGVRGTDVAREAAGIVLLQEDFGCIVAGVRMGRRIFDNLRKVMVYITAIHVPIAGLALLPVLFGLPVLMLPVHVVLTEMVIDPVCSLAFEGAPEERRVMQRPPRPAGEGLVGWPMLWRGLVQGGGLLASTLCVYAVLLTHGRGEEVARTVAIVALTAGNLLLVAANMSQGIAWRRVFGPAFGVFWVVAGIASAVLALGILWPAARQLLRFGVPGPLDVAAALAVTAVAVVAAVAGSRWRGR